MTAAWLLAWCLGAPGLTSPYDLEPLPHVVITGGALTVVGLAEAVVKPNLQGGFNCALGSSGDRCDPLHLWGFDRGVVGQKSAAWRRASDIGALTTLLVPIGASALDSAWAGSTDVWQDVGMDTLVGLESVAITTFLTTTLKFAIRRPRPGLYSPGEATVDGQMSYPSGHTSATMAAATAYAVTFTLRHPDSPWRFAVMGAGAVLTGFTAYGRVAGGMHFYTDVIGGALLGGTVGLVVPYFARRRIPAQLSVVGAGPGEAIGTQRLLMTLAY